MSTDLSPENIPGIAVRHVPLRSSFYSAGLRKGDAVVAVNGEKISDELEFRYLSASPLLRLEVVRNGRPQTLTVRRKHGAFLDVEFREHAVGRCANRCVFCFIDQMPRGLRKRLYVKDEDLAHSFLYGNYVTLTGAGRPELERIARLGLSPLYVSVHATDPAVRNRMLGRKRAPPIMEQLSFLARNHLRFHAQIVVCPGFNDGKVLAETVGDLFSFGKSLLSVAVVPVGLTKYRTFPLRPVDAPAAREICRTMGALSDRDKSACGTRRLFLADELFLRAGAPIPPAAYYEEYPQIENGVGLVRRLLDDWGKARRGTHKTGTRRKKYLLLTSASAFPFLSTIARELEGLRHGMMVHAEPVPNRFFGPTVTVAGLLTARDVRTAARGAAETRRFDGALLPAAMFNYDGYTLDGWSARRIEKKIGMRVRVMDSVEKLLKI